MATLLKRLDNNNNSFSDERILLPRSRIHYASPTPLFLLRRSKLTALIPHRSYGDQYHILCFLAIKKQNYKTIPRLKKGKKYFVLSKIKQKYKNHQQLI
jgi:hypothetical protein